MAGICNEAVDGPRDLTDVGARAAAAAGRYPLLLVVIAADLAVLLVLPVENWGLVLVASLTAATLVLGVLAAAATPNMVRVAIVAAALGLASAAGQVIAGTDLFEALMWLSLSALIIGAIAAIGRDILRSNHVTMDTLIAAVCLYTLVGLAFAFVQMAINADSGNFFAQDGPHSPADFVYFSYIVLSTVGFGDLSPAAGLPRAIVVMESIAGPIFLVTALARLVSLYSARGPSHGDDSDDTT